MRAMLGLWIGLGLGVVPISAQSPWREHFGQAPGDGFGHVICTVGDIDGDAIDDYAVGAPIADADALSNVGTVTVFSGATGATLFTFSGWATGDDFGWSIGPARDVNGDGVDDVVVGAIQDFQAGPGYARVFSGTDGSVLHTWQGEAVNDLFGAAVVGIGDVDGDGKGEVAVGAPNRNLPGPFVPEGRAYVFSGDDGALLYTIDGEQSDRLGAALDTIGDRDGDGLDELLVGEASFGVFAGAASIWSGATGAFLDRVTVGTQGENGGRRVVNLGHVTGDGVEDFATSGEGVARVISGSSLATLTTLDTASPSNQLTGIAAVGDVNGDGAADVIVSDEFSLSQSPPRGLVRVVSLADGETHLYLPGAPGQATFGRGLAGLGDLDGDGAADFAVGIPASIGPGGPGSGRVAIHSTAAPQIVASYPSPTRVADGYGIAVAGAGDVDNDGHDDLIAGAPYDATVAPNAGRVDVISGADGSTLYEFFGDDISDRLGLSVAAAGDVDGDGFADLLAGAPFPAGPVGPGYARVYSGKTGEILIDVEGASPGDRFGIAVAGAGDLDGDGRAEVWVGATHDDVAGPDFGAVRAYSIASTEPLVEILGIASGDDFGLALASASDLDGDGVPDAILGAPGADVLAPGGGRVGAYSGADGSLVWSRDGVVAGAAFGTSVDFAGDVDGDGVPDVVAGSYDEGGARVRVLSGTDGTLMWELPLDNTGVAVSGLPDVDGDGLSDVLVGEPGADESGTDTGTIRIRRGADGASLSALTGPLAGNGFGFAVDVAGDVHGDGGLDLVVGAIAADPLALAGTIYLVELETQPDGPWSDLGGVLPGATGAPALTATGSLEPNSVGELALGNARPLAATTLVVGLSKASTPFKGGTLVPSLDVLVSGLVTDGNGALALPFTWPVGIPSGTTFACQHWIEDATGPAGFAASNAIESAAP